MKQAAVMVETRARALLTELDRLGEYNDSIKYTRELAELVQLLAAGQLPRRRSKRALTEVP